MKELKNGCVKFDLNEANLLSLFLQEVAEHYETTASPAWSRKAKEISDALYEICEKHGFYKGL